MERTYGHRGMMNYQNIASNLKLGKITVNDIELKNIQGVILSLVMENKNKRKTISAYEKKPVKTKKEKDHIKSLTNDVEHIKNLIRSLRRRLERMGLAGGKRKMTKKRNMKKSRETRGTKKTKTHKKKSRKNSK